MKKLILFVMFLTLMSGSIYAVEFPKKKTPKHPQKALKKKKSKYFYNFQN
jgi:hypothetical protein